LPLKLSSKKALKSKIRLKLPRFSGLSKGREVLGINDVG